MSMLAFGRVEAHVTRRQTPKMTAHSTTPMCIGHRATGLLGIPTVSTDLVVPFSTWQTFHHATKNRRDPDIIAVDLTGITEMPNELAVDGVAQRPAQLHQTSEHLDLYPLTVPCGHIFRMNAAALFTEVESDEARDLKICAGGDWHMAWYCNGKLIYHTFTPAGNGRNPVTVFDHDFILPLKPGKNLIGVVVVSGGRGFYLKCAEAPADVAAKRQAIADAEQAHAVKMREQLQGEAKISIDCGKSLGEYLRAEQFQSISLNMAEPASIDALKRDVGHAKFYRAFGCVHGDLILDPSASIPEHRDEQLRAISAVTDEMMTPIPMAGVNEVLAGTMPDEAYVDGLTTALTHMRNQAPNCRWIEVFNESECGDALDTAQHYRFYQLTYQAIDRINSACPDDPPLLLGGPTPCSFNHPRIKMLLKLYAEDTDPRKRLDFIAYHQYLFSMEHNPAIVTGECEQVRAWLREHGLDENLPIHISESGIFPTRNGSEQYSKDLVCQAAGVLSLHFHYVQQGILPYQWTWFHANPRKNMFVPTVYRLDHQEDGSSKPSDPIRDFLRPHCNDDAGRFTPFGNANRLQAKLYDQRVQASASPRNDEGLGMYVLATREDDRIAALVWNYQYIRYDDPQPYEATITFDNLPAALRGNCRMKRWLIDEQHSHYCVDGDALSQVADETIDLAQPITVALQHNAVTLITLEPA